MIQKQLKEMVAKLPEKNDHLPVNFLTIKRNYEDTKAIQDEIEFHEWNYDPTNIEETVDFLFFQTLLGD